MIYAPAFADGSVALTRASKALHESTKRCLYQHGVYRIHIRTKMVSYLDEEHGVDELYRWEMSTAAQRIVPYKFITKAQNLHISITAFKNRYPPNSGRSFTFNDILAAPGNDCRMIMGRIGKAMKKATHCHIQLPRTTLEHFLFPSITGLRLLSQFDTVTMEIMEESRSDWLTYMKDPKAKNHDMFARIRPFLLLREGIDKMPTLGFLRNPPKGYFYPLGHPKHDDDDDLPRRRDVSPAYKGQS